MPTFSQPIGSGIVVADYREDKVVLFDTDAPRWWVVDAAHARRATSSPSARKAFLDELRRKTFTTSTGPDRSEAPYYIIYKLTDKCNFKCTYCYDRNFTRTRNSENRNRAIRECLSNLECTAPGAEVNILFHGGEPLLEYDEIADLISYGAKNSRLNISYSIQTNASLLDQKKFDFLSCHRVGINFSVDGIDENANRLRVNTYDADCYGLVRRKIAEIEGLHPTRVGLLLTIGAHNVTSVLDTILQAERDGFSSVSFSFMHKIDHNTVPATPAQILEMYETFISEVVAGKIKDLAVWPLIEIIQIAMFGRGSSICSTSPCGAGRNLISILPSGEISPCDSLFSDDYVFKDLGVYERARQDSPKFRELLQRSTSSLAECSACDVRQFCNGTCPGNASLSKGTTNAVDDAECNIHYSVIRALVWSLADPRTSEKLLAYTRHHLRRPRHQTAEPSLNG